MSGVRVAYMPGVLAVSFQHGDFDHVEWLFRWTGWSVVETPLDDRSLVPAQASRYDDGALECFLSSVFCPFRDLLAWLEAVVCGVQECAFQWDAEGCDGELRWHRRDAETGFLTITWGADRRRPRLLLEGRQMVQAIYQGFRSFVESAGYEPSRYEFPEAFGADLRQQRSIRVEQWLAPSAA